MEGIVVGGEPFSVVVINYNLEHDTINCVKSLVNAGLPLSSIIVIDNASSEGSVDTIVQHFGEDIQLIHLHENRGYAGGSNVGIRKALDDQAEWILLMNNDTVVDPKFFVQLEWATTKLGDTYKLFSPMILFFDKKNKISFLGDFIVPGTMLTSKKWEGKDIPHNLPGMLPTDFVHGSGMLVHRSVFEQVGLFDPNLFMYFEEVDFCWRARLAGFKMAVIPSAIMWHKDLGTTHKHSPKTHFLRIRNHIWVFRRYSKGLQLLVMFGFSIIRLMGTIIKDSISGSFDLIPYAINGWLDGWFTNCSAYLE